MGTILIVGGMLMVGCSMTLVYYGMLWNANPALVRSETCCAESSPQSAVFCDSKRHGYTGEVFTFGLKTLKVGDYWKCGVPNYQGMNKPWGTRWCNVEIKSYCTDSSNKVVEVWVQPNDGCVMQVNSPAMFAKRIERP